jgi:hypothetical protein
MLSATSFAVQSRSASLEHEDHHRQTSLLFLTGDRGIALRRDNPTRRETHRWGCPDWFRILFPLHSSVDAVSSIHSPVELVAFLL